MEFNELSDEQKKLVRECKTPEELLALANKMNYKLSDEELDAIAGGKSWCSKCSSDWLIG